MALVEMPSLPQALLGLGALYLLYRVYWELSTGAARRAMIRQKGCLPVKRRPQRDPIWGMDLYRDFARLIKAHTFLETALKRFQELNVNTFSQILGGQPLYVTIEPENIKTILALDFKKWSLGERRKRGFKPLLGDGIFTTDGAQWAHSREMLRPNFVRSQVGDLATFETHVANLIASVPRDGTPIDLQDFFFRLTMDSATEFLFGESTACLSPGTSTVSASRFAVAFTRSQDYVSRTARFGMLSKLFYSPQFNGDARYVHDFVDNFVRRGLARADVEKAEGGGGGGGHADRYIFLDELVRQTQDPVAIRSELLNILLAGRDTTASLLSNVWFIVARRPDIWQALRAELDAMLPDRTVPPTYEQLKEMKYLRAVLNESLRLHPVVPANSREALEDTTLPRGGGPDGQAPIFCPKGQVCAWSLYAMHRRKDYFGQDADEFRPERWLDGPDGKKGLRPGWEYLPFNGGPRICIGQQFALTEASYTTVRLMQHFDKLTAADDHVWREWLALTCTVFGGCNVILTPKA